MTRPPFEPVSERDIRIVSAQLGRPARDVVGIPARCVCGAPTVVATAPRLSDGTPFPTLYYLTHPVATAAMSFLEAAQVMVECTELLAADPEVRAAYERAHRDYLADRESIAVVPELARHLGRRHAHPREVPARARRARPLGRPGANPIGDIALERSSWSPDVCQCPDYGVDVPDPARPRRRRHRRPRVTTVPTADPLAARREGRRGGRRGDVDRARGSDAGARRHRARPRVLAQRLRLHDGVEHVARRGRHRRRHRHRRERRRRRAAAARSPAARMSRASARPTGRRRSATTRTTARWSPRCSPGRGTGRGQRRDRHRARGRPAHRFGRVRPGHGCREVERRPDRRGGALGGRQRRRGHQHVAHPQHRATGPRAGTTRSCTRSRTTSSWSRRRATAAAARARSARPRRSPACSRSPGVDREKNASFDASSQGITIAVAAPSEDLVGVLPDGSYVQWSGTSAAAPIVVGPRRAHPQRVPRPRRRERHRTTHPHGRSARARGAEPAVRLRASSIRSRR